MQNENNFIDKRFYFTLKRNPLTIKALYLQAAEEVRLRL